MNEQNNQNPQFGPVPNQGATQQPIQPQMNQQPPMQPDMANVQPAQPMQQAMPQQAQPMMQQQNVNEMPQPGAQQFGNDGMNNGMMQQQVNSQPMQQGPVTPVPPVNQGVQNGISQVPMGQAPQQDIVEQAPLNPIANNQGQVVNNGVYGPSIPIDAPTDATNVGFVAAAAPLPKKKNKGLLAGIILTVIVALGALGYFVIYPYVVKTYLSDPKKVYEATINAAFKNISTTTNDLVHTKGIYNIEGSFSSNMKDLADYTDHTYGINFGIDPEKKNLQAGITLKNEKKNTEHSYFSYIKDGKKYEKFSSYRGYIYSGIANLEETNDFFVSYQELFDTANKVNSEDINYLTNKVSTLLVDSINEDKLSKEDSTVNINGETLKVTNNRYEVDSKVLNETIKTIFKGLANDDKALEILAKMSEKTKDEIKTMLEADLEDSEENNDDVLIISIYTYGLKSDIVGFGLTDKEQENELHYYNKDNYFEFKSNISYDNEETGKKDKTTIEVIGKKDGDITNVSTKVNDEEILTLKVRKWDDKGVDFDYNLNIMELKLNGNIKFVNDVNEERAKWDLEASVKLGEEYIKVTLNISEDWTSEVANINTDAAATLTDEEIKKKREEFMQSLINTPLGKLFTTESGDYSPSIPDYYNGTNNQGNQNNPNVPAGM